MKLNQDKTEAIVISTKQWLRNNPVPMLDIGGEFITPTSAAKNLGVFFYSLLNMEEHVSSIPVSLIAYYHIHNIYTPLH